MTIVDVFDAVKYGSFEDFLKLFNGDINIVEEYTGMNLLQMTLTTGINLEEKKRIVSYLIQNHIDVNYLNKKSGRNALHLLYFCLVKAEPNYLFYLTTILVEVGIDFNCKDKYGAIPLAYLISKNKSKTKDLKELFLYLLSIGSDYQALDNFNKSCLDYAKEFSWRNEFLDYVKEYENGK